MSSPQEIYVTITSAKNLKNVNWRHGPIKPYVVVWVDSQNKLSTQVDGKGDTHPTWNSTLVIPLFGPINNETNLYVDVVHAGNEEHTKPFIGSAKVKLLDVLKDSNNYEEYKKSLKLKRHNGRPQGKVDVKILIRGSGYHVPDSSHTPPYGTPPSVPYGLPPPALYGAVPSASYGAAPLNSYATPSSAPYGSSSPTSYGPPPSAPYVAFQPTSYGPPPSALGQTTLPAYGYPYAHR